MSSPSITNERIFVAGANGQLGKQVVQHLLNRKVPKSQIVAGVRKLDSGKVWADQGIEVREAPYDNADAVVKALKGVQRVLLISSNEIGGARLSQHKTFIEAAKKAGVKLLAYTSLLNAPTSTLGLAPDHINTEKFLQTAGVPYTLLRNGWYFENAFSSVPAFLQYGQRAGSAGEGRFSYASVSDLAEAAAVVLSDAAESKHIGKAYELGGDQSYTHAEFVAVLSSLAGKEVKYADVPKAVYKDILLKAGLPEIFAELVADSDAEAAKGQLHTTSHDLSTLIGHPTQTLKDVLPAALPKSS